MKQGNGVLVAGVAAVAVLAVVAGGALAARQRPADGEAVAAPLPAPTPTQTPTSTPKPKPTAKPSSTPSVYSGPTSPATAGVKLTLSKLPTGRAPQLPYITGRVVRGGIGGDVTIPGKDNIVRGTRINSDALVVLEAESGRTELVRVDSNGVQPDKIPDVASLVTSMNEDAVAFATAPSNPDNTRAKGSTVYWQGTSQTSGRRTLKRPNDWGSTALAVVGDTVYFKADTDQNGTTSTLNAWDSGTDKVTRIKSVRSPEGVDNRGTVAVDFVSGAAQTFCSTVTELDSGKQRWKTCEYAINGFTPDGELALGTPDFRNGGGDPLVAALDSNEGTVRREWTGARFREVVAEDDDHLLMVADTGEGTPGAIIRCSVGTGLCELATPLAKTAGTDLHLLGAWA